jgi:hypothetical protein
MAATGKKSKPRARSREGGADADDVAEPRVAAALVRTSVCRRVPVLIRQQLDRAILLRPDDAPTLEAIARKFELAERYGVTLASLRTYARKLEELVRPVVTSQVVAGVLGCLPEEYRQGLLAGSRVLLLSRIVQALSGHDGASLSVSDLGKLATILSAAARAAPAPSEPKRPAGKGARRTRDADTSLTPSDPTQMAEAVRLLYGLSWPPQETAHPTPVPDTANDKS